jgi:hypothetical protein
MTSDVDSHPSLHNNAVEDLDAFHDTSVADVYHDNPFNQYGEYHFLTAATYSTIHEEGFFDAVMYIDFSDIVDDVIDTLHPEVVTNVYNLNLTDVAKVKLDFALLCPLFGWAPADTIKMPFDVATNVVECQIH